MRGAVLHAMLILKAKMAQPGPGKCGPLQRSIYQTGPRACNTAPGLTALLISSTAASSRHVPSSRPTSAVSSEGAGGVVNAQQRHRGSSSG